MKPRVFIASSVESLDVAKAVNLNLEHVSKNTLWTDIFLPSNITLTTLIDQTKRSDFAIFIFAPDDNTSIRGSQYNTTRDNVLFELGVFIGSIGPERCFIIKPRDVNLHIPTDLHGVTLSDYDNTRPKHELTSALNAACTRIEQSMHLLSSHVKNHTATDLSTSSIEFNTSSFANDILLACFINPKETYNLVQLNQINPKDRAYYKRAISELLSHKLVTIYRVDPLTKYEIYQLTSKGRDYILDSGLAELI